MLIIENWLHSGYTEVLEKRNLKGILYLVLSENFQKKISIEKNAKRYIV